MYSMSDNSVSFDDSSQLYWSETNGDIEESIVEDCKQCIEYMLDLVSFSMNIDENTSDQLEDSKRSQHCIPDPSDDETTADVKDLIDYMLELVSTAVPNAVKTMATNGSSRSQLADDDIEIIEIDDSHQNTNYEVIDLTDSQSKDIQNRDICLMCGRNEEIRYKVNLNGKSHKCCSWECVQTMKNSDCCQVCSSPITRGTQGFRPNFGGGKTSLCSEECLLKYEVEQQPNTQCFTCRKPLIKDKIMFYWQTMEFCSATCVQSRQLVFGSKCAQCHTVVNRQSLGKYSVRFGDIIKQFCVGTCLEAYKKSLKVCAFCQKDLKCCLTICIATFGFGDKMRLREFCDHICKSQYGLMLSARNAFQTHCTQCQRTIDSKNVIEFNYQNKKQTMCSSVCVSAFKYNNKLKTIFCENCHKYGWTNNQSRVSLHILHFSGSTRLFCTKKCMSMYVLKNRKIVACLCCKVKKYNFDLIERFDWFQNESRLFCSLNCLTLFDIAEQERSKLYPYNTKSVCNQCNNSSIPQFFLRVDNIVRKFCTYQCVFQHQRQFLPDSLIANQTLINGSVSEDMNIESLIQSTMWTPSFFGQQKDKSTNGTHMAPIRSNLLTQRLPNDITHKTLNTNTTPTTVSTELSGDSQLSASVCAGTQTLVKEIVKETKEVIVKVPISRTVKNKSTLFRPPSQTKATSCRPFHLEVGVQTEPQLKIICPIFLPIPIFVPIPVSYMQPLAVPLPLPVPFFFKPDPPAPPEPIKPVEAQTSDNLNLTDIQFGEMKDLIHTNDSNHTNDSISHQSSSKRRSQNESVGQPSKRGRRQSEVNPRGRGRGRGRGGRGGRGRGRGRGRPKREEWEVSSSEDEEEVQLDNDSDIEDEIQPNESSNASIDFNQSQQMFAQQNQNNINDDLLQMQFQLNAFPAPTPPLQTPRVEEQKKGRGRGRKKKETDDTSVDNNNGIESQFSTNTTNSGINALRIWLRQSPIYCQTKNILELHQNYLSEIFCKFVEEVCQVHGQAYSPDYIYMLCLDLQKHLAQNNRLDNIFMDPSYKQFIHAMHTRLMNYSPQLTCIQEEHLWDCGQLGAHSPTVLLNTVMYLSTKYFHMTHIEDHTQFSFSNLSKEFAQNGSQCLIYQSTPKRGRKRRTLTLYENQENQLRCPVKLFEFYLSKCPENVTQRRDMFYLYPIEGCVPDSQTWYSTNPLTNASVTKMLQRILVVREIVAISSTPI